MTPFSATFGLGESEEKGSEIIAQFTAKALAFC
jgi:hypothetical protein